jgi:GNAT superfamily N-acetyltransferase
MGDSDTGELTVLAVLPKFEERGIGRAPLSRVCGWLFAVGHDELWLLTTPDPDFRAYGFYQSQGWRAICRAHLPPFRWRVFFTVIGIILTDSSSET